MVFLNPPHHTTALAFVSDAHAVVAQLDSDERVGETMKYLIELDDLYQSMTLNHVARRASTGQGVALLTLYSKGLSAPPSVTGWSTPSAEKERTERLSTLIDAFKLKIRLEATRGHLPVCWGILTAALGLSIERSQYLHLFLHARSLLSAAVRLNDIGPYASQQILLHVARPLVDAEVERCKSLRTGLVLKNEYNPMVDVTFDEEAMGPVSTWPLGEILASRHDLQHSRIFNS
ncbi:hypothetical protein CPB83DRAFT_855175 [Crepidotus variabilis]|uniref:Urease accessory protein UreF n=1 Tax=Crepidotus variabilis TaxID=179855 RepID=A0A9P6JPW6_9AGAR|nr:hypothetical protein CPB83DRAFT_855175 [Crepidotus variabilis]